VVIYRQLALDGFDLDNDSLTHQDVQPIAGVEDEPFERGETASACEETSQ
jgi:hypothetical protein